MKMKYGLAATLVLVSLSGTAYADDSVEHLASQVQKVEKRIDVLEKSHRAGLEGVFDLKKQTVENVLSIRQQQQKLSDLSAKINALEANQEALGGSLDQLSQETESIDKTISNRSKWYGAAILLVILLLGAGYWYLRQRSDAGQKTLSAQVKDAVDSVRSTEEKIARSDTALADSLFEILNKLKVQEMKSAATGTASANEPDHQLPLKLADEIHRMRKRLAALPEETKGLTPLQKSLERLESELAEQGYEIVDHTGMAYTENLSVKARFVPSDDLGPDQKIINKVVVPPVNYKGVMIRMADIEVSIGS